MGKFSMKTTDFSHYLQKYFLHYLPNHCGSTPATIDTYRYAFISFLKFAKEELGIEADRLKISNLTRENVEKWYLWIERACGSSVSTRNQRQAAMNGFVHYLEYEFPEYLLEYQRILSIRPKKSAIPEISYVKEDGMVAILSAVNIHKTNGLRDYLILALMYSTGIRVSELIGIKVKHVSLSEPPSILVHGKGQKSRYVPLFKEVKPFLDRYISEKHLDLPNHENDYLFQNHMRQQFTRQGIDYIVKKYAKIAAAENPDINIPKDFSCHKIRHSTAMGLVDEGVDLIYIRDLLGHVSVKTTEVYAKANSKKKREAIEANASKIVPEEEPQWENNVGLKEWLKSFNKPV